MLRVAPRTGAWIETWSCEDTFALWLVALRMDVWIETTLYMRFSREMIVTSMRGLIKKGI